MVWAVHGLAQPWQTGSWTGLAMDWIGDVVGQSGDVVCSKWSRLAIDCAVRWFVWPCAGLTICLAGHCLD
jgi:hypothetical protein